MSSATSNDKKEEEQPEKFSHLLLALFEIRKMLAFFSSLFQIRRCDKLVLSRHIKHCLMTCQTHDHLNGLTD